MSGIGTHKFHGPVFDRFSIKELENMIFEIQDSRRAFNEESSKSISEEMKARSRPPYVNAHGQNFSYMGMYLRFYMEDLMDYFEKRAPKSFEKFLDKFDRRYPSPYVDDYWDD